MNKYEDALEHDISYCPYNVREHIKSARKEIKRLHEVLNKIKELIEGKENGKKRNNKV